MIKIKKEEYFYWSCPICMKHNRVRPNQTGKVFCFNCQVEYRIPDDEIAKVNKII